MSNKVLFSSGGSVGPLNLHQHFGIGGGRCAAPPCTLSRRAGNARGPTANVARSCPCRTCPRTARRQSRARFHGVLSSVEYLLDGLPLVPGDLRVDLLLQFCPLACRLPRFFRTTCPPPSRESLQTHRQVFTGSWIC